MKMIQTADVIRTLALWAVVLAVGGCCVRKDMPPPSAGYSKSAPTPRDTAKLPAPCTPAWNRLVERKLRIIDASGHGPDVGSREWMDAVGRRSGVVDAAGHGPDPGSEEWCRAVDYKVFGRRW